MIGLYKWILISFCATTMDELLVFMTDKMRYRSRVIRYEGFEKKRRLSSTMFRGRQSMPQVCQTNASKEIRTETSVLQILTPEQCW